MAISINTVCASIANLSISGVTIKGLTNLPDSVQHRDCPMLLPNPANIVTDLRIQVDSFGSASAKKTCTYTLNYVFLYAEVGTGRGLIDHASGWVSKMTAIYDAIAANDYLSGCIDIQPSGFALSIQQDPSGKQFYGASIPLRVMEFIN